MRIIKTAKNFYYKVPTEAEKRMMDFYLLAWEHSLLTAKKIPADENLAFSVEEALTNLTQSLKKEFSEYLLLAINAEFRHVFEHNTADQIKAFYRDTNGWEYIERYLSLTKFKQVDNPYDKDIRGIKKKKKDYQGVASSDDYALQYAVYKQSKIPDGVLVVAAREAFSKLKWAGSYGGKKWAGICQGWIYLQNSKNLTNDIVYIDHIYDLAHNTGPALNKVKEYSGDWVRAALEFKKYTNSPWYLWEKASPAAKDMSTYALKAANIKMPDDLAEKMEKERTKNKPSKPGKEIKSKTPLSFSGVNGSAIPSLNISGNTTIYADLSNFQKIRDLKVSDVVFYVKYGTGLTSYMLQVNKTIAGPKGVFINLYHGETDDSYLDSLIYFTPEMLGAWLEAVGAKDLQKPVSVVPNDKEKQPGVPSDSDSFTLTYVNSYINNKKDVFQVGPGDKVLIEKGKLSSIKSLVNKVSENTTTDSEGVRFWIIKETLNSPWYLNFYFVGGKAIFIGSMSSLTKEEIEKDTTDAFEIIPINTFKEIVSAAGVEVEDVTGESVGNSFVFPETTITFGDNSIGIKKDSTCFVFTGPDPAFRCWVISPYSDVVENITKLFSGTFKKYEMDELVYSKHHLLQNEQEGLVKKITYGDFAKLVESFGGKIESKAEDKAEEATKGGSKGLTITDVYGSNNKINLPAGTRFFAHYDVKQILSSSLHYSTIWFFYPMNVLDYVYFIQPAKNQNLNINESNDYSSPKQLLTSFNEGKLFELSEQDVKSILKKFGFPTQDNEENEENAKDATEDKSVGAKNQSDSAGFTLVNYPDNPNKDVFFGPGTRFFTLKSYKMELDSEDPETWPQMTIWFAKDNMVGYFSLGKNNPVISPSPSNDYQDFTHLLEDVEAGKRVEISEQEIKSYFTAAGYQIKGNGVKEKSDKDSNVESIYITIPKGKGGVKDTIKISSKDLIYLPSSNGTITFPAFCFWFLPEGATESSSATFVHIPLSDHESVYYNSTNYHISNLEKDGLHKKVSLKELLAEMDKYEVTSNVMVKTKDEKGENEVKEDDADDIAFSFTANFSAPDGKDAISKTVTIKKSDKIFKDVIASDIINFWVLPKDAQPTNEKSGIFYSLIKQSTFTSEESVFPNKHFLTNSDATAANVMSYDTLYNLIKKMFPEIHIKPGGETKDKKPWINPKNGNGFEATIESNQGPKTLIIPPGALILTASESKETIKNKKLSDICVWVASAGDLPTDYGKFYQIMPDGGFPIIYIDTSVTNNQELLNDLAGKPKYITSITHEELQSFLEQAYGAKIKKSDVESDNQDNVKAEKANTPWGDPKFNASPPSGDKNKGDETISEILPEIPPDEMWHPPQKGASVNNWYKVATLFKIGNINDTSHIYPKDIYSTYYMSISSSEAFGGIGNGELKPIFEYYAEMLKTKYLKCFKLAVCDQLEKYVGRGRISPGFHKIKQDKDLTSMSLSELKILMENTFRSDMTRLNERWIMLCDLLIRLESATGLKDTLYVLDRINNTVHNTGESMVTKIINGRELLSAFESAHRAKNINTLTPLVYDDLKSSF